MGIDDDGFSVDALRFLFLVLREIDHHNPLNHAL
jgi:hypothetical protein